MDKIYRYQRYVYDFTRKYYLFGRDRLLEKLPLEKGDCVLEIGCGTARNLIYLAKTHPGTHLYGLDASAEMLKTARAKLDSLPKYQITLRQALAEDLDHQKTFNLAEPFDYIFFSYSLSMIPTWRDALCAAFANLKSNGSIYIVDFWDQSGYPVWFQRVLTRWLALFHVRHEPALLHCLQNLQGKGCASLELEAIGKNYAFLAELTAIQENSDISKEIFKEPSAS